MVEYSNEGPVYIKTEQGVGGKEKERMRERLSRALDRFVEDDAG